MSIRNILLTAALVLLATASTAEVDKGDKAPAFDAKPLAGDMIHFPTVDGQPTVVLVWATWCPYCKVLMPRLAQIRKEYGVDILAINAKERGIGDPESFVSENEYDFVVVLDSGDEIADLYGVDFLPGLFVIDGDGEIVFRRGWTELPAGKEVADLWEEQVRTTLEELRS